MNCGNGVLLDGFDGGRFDVLVAIGFEQSFGIGAVGLVSRDVRLHGMRW